MYCQYAVLRKIITGSRMMVSVSETADYNELRKQCFLKEKTFNPQVVLSRQVESHELLYKSMILADIVPGTMSPFILKEYKAEVGVPYSQITFVLNATTTGKNL